VQSVLGALAYLFLLVFFTMQFRHRRWMANELCHGIDGRAPRFKFWIAFVAMVVASCTVYAIFYENGFFETLKISVKPKAQRIDSQIDFGWVKFFVLHAITCAYCTLAVAREYKMRLRDLNLSEKIYRLIFFVHLIPFVNIAAVVIEAVFLGGQKGIESGNNLKPFAVRSTGATARLEELESLKNAGLISSEEYSDKRKEILSGV
jgi:uncharacterized membrane protein YhaH (DUF805 family)